MGFSKQGIPLPLISDRQTIEASELGALTKIENLHWCGSDSRRLKYGEVHQRTNFLSRQAHDEGDSEFCLYCGSGRRDDLGVIRHEEQGDQRVDQLNMWIGSRSPSGDPRTERPR